MVEIIIESEVRPTEDVEKVKKALSTIALSTDIMISEVSPGYKILRMTCRELKCLEPLRNTIKLQQIEPAVRSYIQKNRVQDTIYILVHKQAAYAGWISLIDSDRESPLGPIRIEIRGSPVELDHVVRYLTGD